MRARQCAFFLFDVQPLGVDSARMRGLWQKTKELFATVVEKVRPVALKIGRAIEPALAPLRRIRRIEDFPLPVRRAFYAAPLFVQWIVGITWDPDAGAVKTARRSMALTAVFFAAVAVIVLVFSSFEYFLPRFYYPIGIGLVVVHGIAALGYVGGSIWIAVREWQGHAIELPFLDRFADRLEKIAGA